MSKSAFRQALQDAVEQRHSKVHPFSDAWVTGSLTREILGEWVKQHYHYVSHFPQWCGNIYARCDDSEINHFLLENIMEEEGFVGEGEFSPAKHVELLLDFAEACGKSRQEIKDAQKNGELTAGLLGLQSWCTVQSTRPTHVAVAGLMVGLESQVPQIYKRTTPPLMEQYGFTKEEVTFFRLHIIADTEHGQRGYEIVERLADSDAKQEQCIRAVREATAMRQLYLDALYEAHVARHLKTRTEALV
ncbi:MAG: iron-containing redox enzyme family protein [Candidatus Tectomicrobia bacterium]|nr:iron-containing redox enzyme family protein [Candidatus Tectomicrobia bacterium]